MSESPPSMIPPSRLVTCTAVAVAFVVCKPPSVTSPSEVRVIVPLPALIRAPSAIVSRPPATPLLSSSALTITLPLPLATSPFAVKVTLLSARSVIAPEIVCTSALTERLPAAAPSACRLIEPLPKVPIPAPPDSTSRRPVVDTTSMVPVAIADVCCTADN